MEATTPAVPSIQKKEYNNINKEKEPITPKKNLPVKLLYYEEFQRIDQAFHREKQIQGWSRKKKEALINGWDEELKKAAACLNETHWKNKI